MEDDFDIDKVYEQRDLCIYLGQKWKFVGFNWNHNPGEGYSSFFYTQLKTIGTYPSEGNGWKKI